jgi:diguanylate cyclase (GGDEF)-like protein
VLEERYRVRDGEDGWRWLSRRIVPFRRDQAGWVTEVLGVLRDVTDVVAAEEKLAHDAFHDSLTGLPNRALLLDRLTEALSRSESVGREIGVLYLDLDGFKRVNDTAGHAAGDAVLIETANRLRTVVRQGDTVARVGGDEFVLVIEPWNRADAVPRLDVGPDTTVDRTLALNVADRVVGVLRAPIVVHGVEHRVTASVGITYPSALALDHPGTMTATHVVEEADAAMYWAKQEGKNRVEVFAWT